MQTRPFEELARTIAQRRFKERVFAIMDCYLDESFDMKQQGIFAVGGFLGRGAAWMQIDINWERLRKRPDIDIAYFKSRECQFGDGEFSKFVADSKNITSWERDRLDSIRKEFVRIIANEQVIAYGTGIPQADFYEVIKDADAKLILGDNPYWLAYKIAMICAAWGMDNLAKLDREPHVVKNGRTITAFPSENDREILSFVCDEHERYSPLAYQVYMDLKASNPKAAMYMGSFASADDKLCQPLQCADFMATEIRRTIKISRGDQLRPLSDEFMEFERATKMWYIVHANKQNLESIVAHNKPGEPLNLDFIMEQNITEDIKIT